MIQLTYKVNQKAGTLTLIADAADRDAIRELIESEGANDSTESEALEYMLCNSELQWIHPSDTGDLTDAPLLGIFGEEQRERSGPYGAAGSGRDKDGPLYQPIIERWGYEPYQVRSFLQDLVDTGEAVFTNQW